MLEYGVVLFVFTVLRIQAASIYFNGKATVVLTKVGEYAVLDCKIDFPHDIVIPHILEWRKDGELIFTWADNVPTYAENFANRIHLLTGDHAWQHGRGSINITSIRETDEGWYECKTIFPNRIPSTKANGTWFNLQVEGGSLLAVPPINETVMEGESARMKCVSKSFSAQVTWYKDDVPVTEIDHLKERVRVNPEGSLTIENSEMKDSGYYSCEITSEEGEKQSAGAYLNVQFKAKVIYAPRRVYLAHGRPGHLECYYNANPEITKIRWEKDGFLFDAYNVPGVFARRNGSLYFSKVDDSHAGEYTCTPYNDLGTNGPSPRMNVIVQRAPVFTATPHVLYFRKVGETVAMPCEAIDGEGVDRPNIAWYRTNGAEIPSDRAIISTGNLTIKDIQESDRGYYQCIATNEAATVCSEAELIVQESIRSHAPYNVTVDVGRNSVRVKWLSGQLKPKLKFSVWYRVENAQEWRTIQIDSDEVYETEITNLNPGQTYEVMVLSQDEKGEGMFSKTIKVTTKSEEELEELELESETEIDREFRSPVGLYQQIGPPIDIYIQVEEDGYRVVWKPPKHGHEMLKYYRVIWYKEPSDERVGVIETHDNSAIIKNLEEQKTYKIQIFALSTNDYESFSQKYIYYVPSFPMKKPIFIGAAGGALLVSIVIATLWYVMNLNGKKLIS